LGIVKRRARALSRALVHRHSSLARDQKMTPFLAPWIFGDPRRDAAEPPISVVLSVSLNAAWGGAAT